MSLLAWLAGTRAGQIILAVSATLAALGLALLKAFSMGKATAKSEQAQKTIKAYETRERVENEVYKNGDIVARSELSKWVPTDKRG